MSIKAWLPFSEGTDVSKCLRRASSWRWHWKNFDIFRKQYADTDCISRTILRLSIQLLFLKHWRIVQKGFLTKTAEKDTKHRGSHPKVFCKVDVLKNILRFTGSFFLLSLLHNFIQLSLNSGSNPVRGVSEIRDGEDLWQWSGLQIRLNVFCRST